MSIVQTDTLLSASNLSVVSVHYSVISVMDSCITMLWRCNLVKITSCSSHYHWGQSLHPGQNHQSLSLKYVKHNTQ